MHLSNYFSDQSAELYVYVQLMIFTCQQKYSAQLIPHFKIILERSEPAR